MNKAEAIAAAAEEICESCARQTAANYRTDNGYQLGKRPVGEIISRHVLPIIEAKNDRIIELGRQLDVKDERLKTLERKLRDLEPVVGAEIHFQENPKPVPPPLPTKRPLFCPICGARVLVDVINTNYPEIYRMPDHVPAANVNLCCGTVISVSIDWDKCAKCGRKIGKHPSGVCSDCFRSAWQTRPPVKDDWP